MNTLPVDIIRAILLFTQVGSQLADVALVCRQFATLLNTDVMFALEHIWHEFRVFEETVKAFTYETALDPMDEVVCNELALRLQMLDDHMRHKRLPFAYKAALFALDSHAPMFGLSRYSLDITLHIVQSLDKLFPDNNVNWHNALSHLAHTGQAPALDYVIKNCARGFNEHSAPEAIVCACRFGQAEVVQRLMAVPISDGGIHSLDDALTMAAARDKLDCVNVILNDQLGRVTQHAKDGALLKCVHKGNLPMPALLIQHGILPQALNEALFIAVKKSWTELETLLLMQSDIDPDYQNGVCLEEAVIQNDTSVLKLLLDDGRVSISANDYRALRMALRSKKTAHVNHFLEAAKRLEDLKAVRIVNEPLPPTAGEVLLAEIHGTSKQNDIKSFWQRKWQR
ncbi:hypothetical protein HDU80_010823 [Chytriomyces hyalinus]|nr:hypothetical protein HDU80_010823 [Chytriomyces hyalinus]